VTPLVSHDHPELLSLSALPVFLFVPSYPCFSDGPFQGLVHLSFPADPDSVHVVYPAVMKLLLEKGANTKDVLHIGATALFMSAQTRHPEVVKLLLDKGANTEAALHIGATAL